MGEGSRSSRGRCVLAGSGHLDYHLGVPERVGQVESTCIITSRYGLSLVRCKVFSSRALEEGVGEEEVEGFQRVEHFAHQFPGDFVFIYREGEEEGGEEEGGVKEEVARAYDRVASTALIPGLA